VSTTRKDVSAASNLDEPYPRETFTILIWGSDREKFGAPVFALCLLAIPSLHPQTKRVTAAEGKDHIGERATVCGKVVSTHPRVRTRIFKFALPAG
jgi:hypothetical protein